MDYDFVKRELDRNRLYSYTCTEPLNTTQMLQIYKKIGGRRKNA